MNEPNNVLTVHIRPVRKVFSQRPEEIGRDEGPMKRWGHHLAIRLPMGLVKKLSSLETLWFDVVNSTRLSEDQGELVVRRLAIRIGKDGVLRAISQQTRTSQPTRNWLCIDLWN